MQQKALFSLFCYKKSLGDRQDVRKSGFEEENSSCSHSAASQLSPLLSGGGEIPAGLHNGAAGITGPPAGEQPGNGGSREGGREGMEERRAQYLINPTWDSCVVTVFELLQGAVIHNNSITQSLTCYYYPIQIYHHLLSSFTDHVDVSKHVRE